MKLWAQRKDQRQDLHWLSEGAHISSDIILPLTTKLKQVQELAGQAEPYENHPVHVEALSILDPTLEQMVQQMEMMV